MTYPGLPPSGHAWPPRAVLTAQTEALKTRRREPSARYQGFECLLFCRGYELRVCEQSVRMFEFVTRAREVLLPHTIGHMPRATATTGCVCSGSTA